MPSDMLAMMDKLDIFLMHLVRQIPWDLFPWATQLSVPDQRAFVLDILQAVHSRDLQQLQQCIEDWQATAEALANDALMHAIQQPYDPGDYVSWEQVRGELNLLRNPEEGRS